MLRLNALMRHKPDLRCWMESVVDRRHYTMWTRFWRILQIATAILLRLFTKKKPDLELVDLISTRREEIGFLRRSAVWVRTRDSTPLGDTVREMEAADWASLSDQELLERRISKLGLRLDERSNRSSGSSTTSFRPRDSRFIRRVTSAMNGSCPSASRRFSCRFFSCTTGCARWSGR